MRDGRAPFHPLLPLVRAVEDPPEKQRQLHELASRLLRTIGVARALVRSGRTLNLDGMDDGVGLLCAQALDLPPADGQAMLPQLRDVLASVDELTAALHQADEDDHPLRRGY